MLKCEMGPIFNQSSVNQLAGFLSVNVGLHTLLGRVSNGAVGHYSSRVEAPWWEGLWTVLNQLHLRS